MIDTFGLAPEQELAVNYTPQAYRARLATAFALDCRMAKLVAGTSEQLLGKMRLAWWREALAAPVGDRPGGDEVLDAIGLHWNGDEDHLIRLVDGWEYMLTEGALEADAIENFVAGRVAPLHILSGEAPSSQTANAINSATRAWALADMLAHLSDPEERQIVLTSARNLPENPERLQREYRGVAVLGALGRHALKLGGPPMMKGRGAALVALRAGLLGR